MNHEKEVKNSSEDLNPGNLRKKTTETLVLSKLEEPLYSYLKMSSTALNDHIKNDFSR